MRYEPDVIETLLGVYLMGNRVDYTQLREIKDRLGVSETYLFGEGLLAIDMDVMYNTRYSVSQKGLDYINERETKQNYKT